MPAAWVVIVLILWIISTVNKAKKAQENQGKKPARPVQSGDKKPAQFKTLEDAIQQNRAVQPAAAPASPPLQPRMEHRLSQEPAHTARPLEAHMHTPVMDLEGDGTEGIDCCHDYMLSGPETNEPADFLPLQEEEAAARAKALLQGVIFSEILGRRTVKRHGRRSA